tara:strand:+ start:257 stop:1051 length:795 start_codon:yes stop_codon:yes gene_type:complete
MYNYKLFESKKKINYNQLLLNIKKLLPKHINCIPDNAALSILETIKRTKQKNYMLETGAGASTIALFLGSFIKKKKFFTFETSAARISQIRQVINESICDPLKINLSDYWIPINSDSLCPYTGIKALKAFNKKFDFAFLDSEHTLIHLTKEVSSFLELTDKAFYLGIDDGHMNYKKVNIDYKNLIRNKINLRPLKIKDNVCSEFYLEILDLLKSKYKNSRLIKPVKRLNSKKDLYFKYYGELTFKPTELKKNITYKTCFYYTKK